MKLSLFKIILLLCPILVIAQTNSIKDKYEYLLTYDIHKDSINELTFKNKTEFNNFVKTFEEKEGFQIPTFFIFDNTNKLIRHKLDKYRKACGKGDVDNLKKKYIKNSPSLENFNSFFSNKIIPPNENNYVVIFVWMAHMGTDKFNKHAFETYNVWKQNSNITIYFINMDFQES